MKANILFILIAALSIMATHSYGIELFPFVGAMTPDELAASKSAEPPISDAKWHHEACIISYQKVGEIDREMAGLEGLRLADSGADHQARIDQQVTFLQKDKQSYRGNIEMCQKGTYYREGIASVCAEFGLDGSGNPFCGLLEGNKIGEVKLTDDLLAMQKSIAWIKLGKLRDVGVAYKPQPWQATGSLGDPNEIMLVLRECMMVEDLEDRLECFHTLGAEVSREMRQKLGVYALGGVKGETSAQGGTSNVGNWTLTLEMVRGDRSMADPAVLEGLKALSVASGLPWSIDNVAQYPRMHFQIMLDDLLFADDTADFFSVDSAGKEQWLGEGVFEKHRYGPFMYTNYESYRGHIGWTPSPSAWQIIHGADTGKLVVKTRIFREDGAIDLISFPVGMANFGAALKQLGSDQQEAIGIVSDFESQLKEIVSETEQEISVQKSLQYSAEQARRYALNSALKRANRVLGETVEIERCAVMSSLTNSATASAINTVRQYQTRFRQCATGYSKHYEGSIRDVSALLLEIEKLEKQHPMAVRLKSVRDGWRGAMEKHRHEERRIENHITQLQERQYAEKRNAEREVRTIVRYRERRPRRHANTVEYDAAARFFEDQRNPQPIFHDIVVPRRANGYIGAGYY